MARSGRYKLVSHEMSLLDAVSNAYGEIQSLLEEMSEWRDNLEESLSHTPKYEQVSEAADTLENATEEPSLPTELENKLKNVSITVGETVLAWKSRSGPSRATRLGNACGYLSGVVDHLQGIIDDNTPAPGWKPGEPDAETLFSEDEVEEIDNYMQELQSTIDNIEGVEFPGMYG